ncbi:MerR family transcriptional regulator [Phaeobacter sp. LSS9]|nr:MerR family transcriptional regulator [Phaeobacter sp. LSS9]
MSKYSIQKRIYDDSDPELNIIAGKSKRAQWRHRRIGPAFIKFGRRVKYAGADLNAWIEQNRVLPTGSGSHV